MNWIKKLFNISNEVSAPQIMQLDAVVNDPDGKLRRLSSDGGTLPPRSTDYWEEEDFLKFTGQTEYGDIFAAIPKIRKHFPNLALTDEELKKIIAIVTQINKEYFIKMVDKFSRS